MRSHLLLPTLLPLLLVTPPLPAQAAWTRIYPSAPAPAGRRGHAMAFDPVQQRVLLFGGQNSTILGDFWAFDGVAWTQLPAGPTNRFDHAMVFDTARGRLVLFGGTTGSGYEQDTWEWDGSSWSMRAFAVRPPARVCAGMAFDPRRGRTVLFGGSGSSMLGDLWEYDGSSWQQRTVSGSAPGPRSCPSLAFDPNTGATLLFGGVDNYLLDDTWRWDGASWTRYLPATPPFARALASMVTDTARARVVLFGGSSFDVRTWEWDGTQWHAQAALGPAPRGQQAMAYDSSRRQVLLFSGSSGGGMLQDTWVYRTPSPAAFVAFGQGCAGSVSTPGLRNAAYSLPWLGDRLRVQATASAPTSTLAVLATGPASLPLSLQAFGMPGCEAWLAPLALQTGLFAAGVAEWSLPVPNRPELAGAQLACQALVLDPVNAAGAVVSNAAELTVGIR